ncbi:MAG: YfiR family protein [Myxococcales bacterium]
MKAAFVLNFAQFTEWPPDAFASAAAPLEIGVLAAAGQHSGGGRGGRRRAGDQRPARRRPPVGRRRYVRPCHLLFVDAAAEGQFAAARTARAGRRPDGRRRPVEFADDGGVVRLFTEENRMRFEIVARAAEQARVRISTKLLKLAGPLTPPAPRDTTGGPRPAAPPGRTYPSCHDPP